MWFYNKNMSILFLYSKIHIIFPEKKKKKYFIFNIIFDYVNYSVARLFKMLNETLDGLFQHLYSS